VDIACYGTCVVDGRYCIYTVYRKLGLCGRRKLEEKYRVIVLMIVVSGRYVTRVVKVVVVKLVSLIVGRM
jgi:hypothetical protein